MILSANPEKAFIEAKEIEKEAQKTDTNEVWVSGINLPLGDTYKNVFFEKINQKTF